jgi:hypothetical protein
MGVRVDKVNYVCLSDSSSSDNKNSFDVCEIIVSFTHIYKSLQIAVFNKRGCEDPLTLNY